jgi:hypothetical protein
MDLLVVNIFVLRLTFDSSGLGVSGRPCNDRYEAGDDDERGAVATYSSPRDTYVLPLRYRHQSSHDGQPVQQAGWSAVAAGIRRHGHRGAA